MAELATEKGVVMVMISAGNEDVWWLNYRKSFKLLVPSGVQTPPGDASKFPDWRLVVEVPV